MPLSTEHALAGAGLRFSIERNGHRQVVVKGWREARPQTGKTGFAKHLNLLMLDCDKIRAWLPLINRARKCDNGAIMSRPGDELVDPFAISMAANQKETLIYG